MQGDRAMQEDPPLGEVQEQQPSSRPPSNSTNDTEYNDLNVPTLASKFEELIAALPPLPMPISRPSPAVGRQGAKRRRGGADSLLNKATNKSPIIKQKKQQLQEEDDTLYCSLVGHRVGVWLPAPSPASTTSNGIAENINNENPSTSSNKNGAYRFGRIIGQENLPPYRQIIKYDTPIEGTECSYLNLKTEIWVALCDDDVNKNSNTSPAGITAAPAAAATTTPDKGAEETPTPNIKKQEGERTPETKRARPVNFLSPKCSAPASLVIENDHLSVYSTTCGPAGYEIYAVLPDTLRVEDIKVKCFARGKVQLKVKQPATPEETSRGGGGDGDEAQVEQAPEKELGPELVYTVDLPSKIYPESARALFTSTGQLYLRVDSQKKNTATGGKGPLKRPSSENKDE